MLARTILRRAVLPPALVGAAILVSILTTSTPQRSAPTSTHRVDGFAMTVIAHADAPVRQISDADAVAAVRARLAALNRNVSAVDLGVATVLYQPGLTQLTNRQGAVIYTSSTPRNAVVVALNGGGAEGFVVQAWGLVDAAVGTVFMAQEFVQLPANHPLPFEVNKPPAGGQDVIPNTGQLPYINRTYCSPSGVPDVPPTCHQVPLVPMF